MQVSTGAGDLASSCNLQKAVFTHRRQLPWEYMDKRPHEHLLGRLVEDLAACIDRETLAELALFHPSDGVQADIDALANGLADGKLNADELAVYETVATFFDFLDLLKLTAQKRLTRGTANDR